MTYRTVLLFGAPGSGKGTQGRILGMVPNFFYFSSGDAFRNLRPDDPVGRVFLEYSTRGQLVPDEITLRLWTQLMQAGIQRGAFHPERDTLVLDGIPRSRRQAEMLQDSIEVKAVVHLSCADSNVLIERLQRRARQENRPDDASLDVIKKRLETYEQQTRSVLDFYGPKLVHPIDAGQSPLRVLRDIIEVLARLDTHKL